MNIDILSKEVVLAFKYYLQNEEKSDATIEKYIRDVNYFMCYAGNRVLTKELSIAYKKKLIADGYAVRSINSIISAINSLFDFMGKTECKIKSIKLQRQIYCPEERELSRAEYVRLINAANKSGDERLSLILQTICSSGIRVGELQYITVEAVKKGEATVSCKGKIRTIFIAKDLRKKLLCYISNKKITHGTVFISKNGKPLNRSNIWRDMKALCIEADVNPKKVFPHNLRHLFARIFYSIEKDIAKLADILGHSSINTTRIYIITTGREHKQKIESMRLVV